MRNGLCPFLTSSKKNGLLEINIGCILSSHGFKCTSRHLRYPLMPHHHHHTKELFCDFAFTKRRKKQICSLHLPDYCVYDGKTTPLSQTTLPNMRLRNLPDQSNASKPSVSQIKANGTPLQLHWVKVRQLACECQFCSMNFIYFRPVILKPLDYYLKRSEGASRMAQL